MKAPQLINAKEIRNDLAGFLRKLKSGQDITIIYRSKPVVTIAAKQQPTSQGPAPGSPEAIKEAIALARRIDQTYKPVLDPNKPYKELRDDMYADYLR